MREAMLLGWTGICFWAVGQVWLAQVVLYPLFQRVGETDYICYHRFYALRAPLAMAAPGFACFLFPIPLAVFGPGMPEWMHTANIALGVVGLLVAMAVETPRHAHLEIGGKDTEVIDELICCNWPRTISVTLQGALTVGMLGHVLTID
jgi:hypothetical protein